MSDKPNAKSKQSQADDLRREAERRLQNKNAASVEGTADVNVRAMLHELQVHQIELEMQNEVLLRAQTALQEVYDKYLDLFEFAPSGYFSLDGQGRILEINLAGAAMLGLNRSTAVSQLFGNYIAPRARAQFARFVRDTLAAEEKQTCEIELRINGEPAYVILEGTPAQDGTGNRFLHITATNITQRKLMEDAVRESEERLRLMTEAVKDYAIFMLDAEGRVVTWNSGAQRLKGYTADEILGVNFAKFYPPADIAAGKPHRELTRALEQGTYAEEGWRVRKDGSRFWAAVTITALRDEAGRLRGFGKVTRNMSEWRAITEKLESLAQFPEENPNPVLRLSADGHVLYANAAAKKLLRGSGRETQSPAGMLEEAARNAFASDTITEIEIGCAGDRFFSFLCTPMPQKQYVNLYGRDITERKRAEEALGRSERLRRLAQEITSVGTFEWNIVTGVNTWTPELEALYGLPPGRFPGTQSAWEQMVHPEDQALAVAAVEQAFDTSRTVECEWRVLWPDRSSHWLAGRFRVIRDEGGKPLVLTGVNIDITERKHAEQELIEGRQRLAGIVDSAMDAIISVDAAEHIVLFNAAAEKMFRCPAAEAIGQPLDRFIPEQFREAHTKHIKVFGESGTTSRAMGQLGSLTALRSGGDEFQMEASISQIEVHGQKLFTVILRDITERKRAEEALARAKDELEQRVATRTAELAERAVELRNLAGELTLTEQRERSRLAKVLHDQLQQLLVAAKFRTAVLGRGGDELLRQATKEVQDLLDEVISASRDLTAELSPPILQEAGLSAGLQWLARRMADKHGLFVDLEADDNNALPEQLRLLLFESVRELLFNVVKHARTAAASVCMRHVDGHLQITVSDRGVGFDPTELTAAGGREKGFGLVAIRERLGFMGGMLQIHSTPGQGSRFVMSVPVAQASATEPPLESIQVLPEAPLVISNSLGPERKIRIMLADDHAVVRQGIANLLRDQPDMEVVGQAADGQEAVALAARLLPDVILMDMSMPKLNGVEATCIIHNDWPEIRVIGLSMFVEADRAQAMRDVGAVDYLSKSGPAEAMIDAIRTSVRDSN